MKKGLPHFLTALLVFVLTGPGLGYRHLWQDEIETAERARTILESGYPRVMDESGTLSLNAGGREIEEGVAHRYTPWLQFYWGAAGLAFQRSDQAVRTPFVLAHAAASGLISYGMSAAAGMPLLLATGIGTAFGLQTIPIVHARTARYHALLELFFVMGLVGIGLLKTRSRRIGFLFLSSSIFLLPHAQTLAGSAFSACLCLLGAITLRNWRTVFRGIFLPGLISLILLVLLTRPWAQGAWGTIGSRHLRSIQDFLNISYALYFGLICALIFWFLKLRKEAAVLFTAILSIILLVRVLDLHPFSQTRYYLAAVFVGLLWPVYLAIHDWAPRRRRIAGGAVLAAVLLPELVIAPLQLPEAGFLPFHGVRLSWSDFAHERAGTRQPLRLATDFVREHGELADPVLIDYVPQFANWYLPGHPIAIVPDPIVKTRLNENSPVWAVEPPMPRWHIFYPENPGLWVCGKKCDFTVANGPEAGTYLLSSKRLKQTALMCVVKLYPTEYWLNSPFRMLVAEAFQPTGEEKLLLAVGTPCKGKGANDQR